jgi:hypothetical protein
MRAITLLLVCSVALFCGCSDDDHIYRGSGDAGPFILQSVRAIGGHPIATNGLPTLDGDWRYLHNEMGIAVLFPASQYTNVDAYLGAAFGPPFGLPARSIRHVGAYVYLDRIDTNTEVDILPPEPWKPYRQSWLSRIFGK